MGVGVLQLMLSILVAKHTLNVIQHPLLEGNPAIAKPVGLISPFRLLFYTVYIMSQQLRLTRMLPQLLVLEVHTEGIIF